MAPNVAIICLILTFSGLCLSEVWGRSFSKQQPVISIKEKQQIYDCVDFYNQPAFSNPLLKNISSKVRPKLAAKEEKRAKEIGLKNGGCPYGTVPILRMIGGNSHEGEIPLPPPPPKPQAHCSATVFTVEDGRKYLGASGALSLNKPVVHKPGQWTAARVELRHDPESIEAGWMVFPDLFKDNEAHLYAKFETRQGGCINTQCQGFVQVSTYAPLGITPKTYSTYGGQQYSWNITIEKHQDDGNWWLTLSGEETHDVGYWPKSLFSELADVATQANWGGEIENPGPNSPPPEMGNGLRATYDTGETAYVRHIIVVDESFHSVDPDNTKKFWDCEELYDVKDAGYQGEFWAHTLVYGGPR